MPLASLLDCLRDYDDAELHLTDAEALALTTISVLTSTLPMPFWQWRKATMRTRSRHTIGINTPAAIELAALIAFHVSHGFRISDRSKRLSIPPK